jgi:EAL domain-containing protein (putative c-di-GMP-specific phosphodiesterase class I)
VIHSQGLEEMSLYLLNDAAIVTAIFAMAHTMNLKVIAEGVETLEQLEFLRSLKRKFIDSLICDGAQGYYFSKPVPPEEFTKLFNRQIFYI